MVQFIGRQRELELLTRELNEVRDATGGERPGRCLLLRGRRRVGKSRLVETFADRSGAPFLYFTASGGGTERELSRLAGDAVRSSLPQAALLAQAGPADWGAALELLAATLPDDRACIVVIDEVPYLMGNDEAFEGTLQRSWDRFLERKPVLLILIGSDLSMMEALNSYERPFHQRGREMVVGPLNPAEIGRMLGLEPAAALDAALLTGGLPLICGAWPVGADRTEFLAAAVSNPVSSLIVSAERSLAAEFPPAAQARLVLRAIGSGERTFGNIAKAAGGLGATPLTRALDTLVEKRIVAAELPISLRPSREKRYRVADPYLRFWLRFIDPYMDEIERGRADLALARIEQSWTSWRGRAIEPLIREGLSRILPDEKLPDAPVVGSYWTRTNDIEIDIVGADRQPVAREYRFLGSIKWLENSPFDDHDRAALTRHWAALTDQPVPLIAVSRSGTSTTSLDAVYGPEDIIAAWR
jgi:AAA+ ATPase superfamily predicted ATPase